jgi:hypothetical protein
MIPASGHAASIALKMHLHAEIGETVLSLGATPGDCARLEVAKKHPGSASCTES